MNKRSTGEKDEVETMKELQQRLKHLQNTMENLNEERFKSEDGSKVLRFLGELLEQGINLTENTESNIQNLRDLGDRLKKSLLELGMKEVEENSESSTKNRIIPPRGSIPDSSGSEEVSEPTEGFSGTTQPPEREIPVDVMTEEDTIIVIAELPGVDRENINLERKDNQLILTAESPIRRYRESILIPGNLGEKKEMVFNNGILQLTFDRMTDNHGS